MKLRVWINDRPVGWLARDGHGSTFAYDDGVDPDDAISLNMPVRTRSYDQAFGLLPIFDTNLPEGSLRDRITKTISKVKGRIDGLDILEVTGANQIGRIRVLADGKSPSRRATINSIDEILDQEASQALIDEIMDKYAMHSGVSGAMPKVLIEESHGQSFEKPSEGHDGKRVTLQTREYIFKFDADDYPGLSLNEYFGLEVAKAAGCEVADAKLSSDRHILAVRRFDEDHGERLGFEDMASLNTKRSEHKYDGSIERHLFKQVEFFSGENKRSNLEELFRLSVVNIAVRNGDAHLKNYALLYDKTATGSPKLTPAYDIVTTTAYLKNDMMSLSLGGTKRWPKHKALLALGARAKLTPKRSAEIIEEVADAVRKTMPAMLAEFEACGKKELGELIAAQWDDGLVSSLDSTPARPTQDPFDDVASKNATKTNDLENDQ
ncbi:type II toxin-antitoxin system HipA family toxin [Pseudosulfitobacter pseudonitzschiae]|uniref:type II toxin-antitoxin system HipA family toxin n=1 Tax=Pseudosulfitobacter pseudonitzschiae TaxID=1402135 RepID=UPI003B794B05